ncbi:MAG: hypothetical protein DCC88_03575 [Spirobacillus cienkowskii]|jgi:hypothetical protein|uniref:Uncharacterized protein n=1 Tax=Spirobacillus cienkowskii TaxID=495820 RepID=A0A369KPY1_9BACT|nr:MAG: hypothetical protein DCC88_03575 [Spirobacillus cienkowskii]
MLYNENKNYFLEEKKVIKQIQDWKYFLNNTIGLFSFTFAISCAGLEPKNSILWNFLSIAVIIVLLVKNKNIFPEVIILIRNKKEKTEDDMRLLRLYKEELLKMKKFEPTKKKYKLSNIKNSMIAIYHSFKETPLYWIGFLSLFILLYYNFMSFMIFK